MKKRKRREKEKEPTKANVPIAQNTQFYKPTHFVIVEYIEYNIHKDSCLY